jgi:hypothetical protein
MNFVAAKIKGFLGNQLFQQAACFAYSRKYGYECTLPAQTMNPEAWPLYKIDGLTYHNVIGIDIHTATFIQEAQFHYKELPAPTTKYVLLDGYFQSEKYFANCKDEIINLFRPKTMRIENRVAIHVRRGDYLQLQNYHPVQEFDYYQQAINYFNRLGYYRFIVFSDGMDWCKHHFSADHFSESTFEFSEQLGAWDDLQYMISCEHQIIANSSYSWWGSYLNPNPNKIIICPKKWFGSAYAHFDTIDLIPENWIRI